MAIKKTIQQACCGNTGSTIIFYIDKPITKLMVPIFEAAGYTCPAHYTNSGIFYARKDGLVANTSMGTTKITVKCGAFERDQKLAEFENILNQALNS